ncbi:MAG: head GIN domain-containing protein [Anaerolineae bacterium]
MRTKTAFLSLLLVAALLSGCCSLIPPIPRIGRIGNIGGVRPSGVIVTETRDVSGFSALDMRTLGKVVLAQGDSELLTITGSDNIVALVTTTVSDGVLTIETNRPINIAGTNSDNVLTFNITVQDLTGITISGLADVEMDTLNTSTLAVTMSGAGKLVLGTLSADSVDITVSGLGDVEIGGQVTQQRIEISGAGGVQNGDLECQTANVTISGLGSATVWVTGELTGVISGGGNVRYYGSPQTNTQSTGVGKFESLGNK